MSTNALDEPKGPTLRAITGHVTYFLTVAIHTILAERRCYPTYSFITARAYNLPVKQSRVPDVCSWIQAAVTAVRKELVSGSVARVVVALAHPDSCDILERFVFDMEKLPRVPATELQTPLVWGNEESDEESSQPREEPPVPEGPDGPQAHELVDLTEQLRSALAAISVRGRRLQTLPEGCIPTVAIELRDDADAPIGHPQPWVPVEPEVQRLKGLPPGQTRPSMSASEDGSQGASSPQGSAESQTKDAGRRPMGKTLGGHRTFPMRAIDAPAQGVAFEFWVEESNTKEAQIGLQTKSKDRPDHH